MLHKLFILFTLLLPTVGFSKPSQPNIIFVLTDDMAWGELGTSGNKIIHTPTLDKFADESLQFMNFHVAPSCAPTRAQLMSGRHEFHAGVTHTIKIFGNLRDDIKILPQYMKSAGYKTGLFGKWHLANRETGHTGKKIKPEYRGFDETVWHHNQLPRFNPKLTHNGKKEQYKGYCADVIFNEAMKWMDSHKPGQPFFTYLPTSIPHKPIAAPEKYYKHYETTSLTDDQKGYYAMVSAVDDNMARLFRWLEKKPFADNTIVIFMTDNGHAIGGADGAGHDDDGFLLEGGLYNAGMRGGKGQAWQGTSCVPFMIHWPGVTKPGKCNVLTSGTDILPTLADIVGAKVRDKGVTGISLKKFIHDPEAAADPDRVLISHKSRWGDKKPESSKYNYVAVFNKQYRLVWGEMLEGKPSKPALYDYLADPGEKADIIDQHPELVAQWTKHFDQWWEEAKTFMVNDFDTEWSEKK